MSQYNIKYTDVNLPPIQINDGDINTQSVDIALFGHIKLEYGELLNENFLHLLENFSCPQASSGPVSPDLTIATKDTLSHPALGQVWFNSTDKTPYVCTDITNPPVWMPLATSSDYAANWGKIYHGQQLPLPVSSSGYEFAYDECVWVLTPSGTNVDFQYMVCSASETGLVNHQYVVAGSNTLVNGIANYMIIGIKSNTNDGAIAILPNPPTTPNVTPTPSVGTSVTPTPSVTPSVTPTIAPTVTPTVTPTRVIPPIQGTVFISPSLGWYNKFLSGGRCGTYGLPPLLDPSFDCVDLTHLDNGTLNIASCMTQKRLEVWVTDITGGDGGPYSLTWNLGFFYSCFAKSTPATRSPGDCNDGVIPNIYPPSGITFTGGTSGYSVNIGNYTTGLVIPAGVTTGNNVIPEQFAYCRAVANRVVTPANPHLNQSGSIVSPYSISLTLLNGSSVTIRDGSGNTITYYIPGGSGGAVSGTQLISPSGTNYSDGYSASYP